ncbi:MAG: hypothetical protein PWR20_1889 [Bacteroidales bacterium]|jgi:hypothetical protein|nr:hypothetical protein [Bacteroidales bacterium]MDN5329044.1 hypothetical protein [Bacteroidales bacterium]
MKKVLIILLGFNFLFTVSFAQTISEITLQKDVKGKSKLKKAPKKAFIAGFRVMYQLIYSAEEVKKGAVYEDFVIGESKASLTLGLHGLSERDLIDNTNYLYQEFVQRLRDEGYEVITASDLPPIKEFEGWEKKQGGKLINAQFKGYAMCYPEGFEYYVKGTKADGREKTTFTDNSAKISHQAGNIMVIKVNLVLPMAEDAESYASRALDLGGAKVVAEPKLTLSNRLLVGKGLINNVTTGVSFINSEAMGLPTSFGVYSLKDEVEISGVVESKKYKVEANRDYDFWGGAGAWRVFEWEDRVMKKVIPVEVDPNTYNAGVRMACSAFLNKAIDDYFGD